MQPNVFFQRDAIRQIANTERQAMHFSFSEEETMIRDTARRLARERLAPLAATLDRGGGQAEMLSNLKTIAEAGFMALNVSAIAVSPSW